MKYFIAFIIIYIIGALILSSIASAASFDWKLGQPAVVENTADTTTTRYDWVLGEPSITFDATFVAPVAGGGAVDDIFWFN